MDKIYEQAKDLHVVATIVYNNGDEFAYTDAGCTKKYKTSELKEVFIKGALIKVNDGLYKVTNFVNGAIGFINASGTAETLKSEADSVTE